MNEKVNVLAMLDERIAVDRAGMIRPDKVITIRGAVAQLLIDVQASLIMLEREGRGDSPVAGFLRAALARAGDTA